jgi:thioredoxin-related protein
MMITRRKFSTLALGAAAGVALTPAEILAANKYEPVLGENGHYTQPWFLESFLEFSDDVKEAQDQGKRFALMWELEGCPYCRETHFVNFGVPEINDYVRDNFLIVQLDVKGSREVVGFDGQTMSEKSFARANGVRFTPTIQFFPESLGDLSDADKAKPEIARMPGYFRPFHFLTMFQFVREKAYEKQDFRAYLKSRIASYKDAGKPLPDWKS